MYVESPFLPVGKSQYLLSIANAFFYGVFPTCRVEEKVVIGLLNHSVDWKLTFFCREKYTGAHQNGYDSKCLSRVRYKTAFLIHLTAARVGYEVVPYEMS